MILPFSRRPNSLCKYSRQPWRFEVIICPATKMERAYMGKHKPVSFIPVNLIITVALSLLLIACKQESGVSDTVSIAAEKNVASKQISNYCSVKKQHQELNLAISAIISLTSLMSSLNSTTSLTLTLVSHFTYVSCNLTELFSNFSQL